MVDISSATCTTIGYNFFKLNCILSTKKKLLKYTKAHLQIYTQIMLSQASNNWYFTYIILAYYIILYMYLGTYRQSNIIQH